MIAAVSTCRQETGETYRDLMELIVEAYHDELRATLPRLEKLADQVARERRVPICILDKLLREFSALADSLRNHLLQQEGDLFPMIRKACESSERAGHPSHLGHTLKYLMDEATHEDQEAVASVRRADHCFRGFDGLRSEPLVLKLVKGLRELREDLEEHVKLETNVLFPAVRELLWGNDSPKVPGVCSDFPYPSGESEPKKTPDRFPDLKCVLHSLRDRLSVDKAIALGMRLPRGVRRIYYEDWQHRWDRAVRPQAEDFLREIAESHKDAPNRDPEELARRVFRTLAAQMPVRVVEEVRSLLPPGEICSLWPAAAESAPMAEWIVADQETG